MSTTQQPEATRLVDKYEIDGFLQDHRFAQDEWCRQAVAELRRLHAENQDLRARVQELGEMARENRSKRVIELEQRIAEMEEQMAAIGAGGVESLRKRTAPAVVAVQEETHVDNLFDAVLNCPHAITAESVTLHFYPKQEGHTALTQLRHRLATGGQAQAVEKSEVDLLPPMGIRNDRDMLNYLMAAFDSEVSYCERCGHGEDTKDMDSASYLRDYLAAAPKAQADARDVERWMGIGKAIERACVDLPEETEIIVSLEKDAGTVTLIDQDGNEHENFSCDYGFAGVLNEAIDAAIAAQAKNGGEA